MQEAGEDSQDATRAEASCRRVLIVTARRLSKAESCRSMVV